MKAQRMLVAVLLTAVALVGAVMFVAAVAGYGNDWTAGVGVTMLIGSAFIAARLAGWTNRD